jgi:hypothetical protein
VGAVVDGPADPAPVPSDADGTEPAGAERGLADASDAPAGGASAANPGGEIPANDEPCAADAPSARAAPPGWTACAHAEPAPQAPIDTAAASNSRAPFIIRT